VRISLEKRLQATVAQLGSEKDGEIQQLQDRIRALEQHIETVCQQHEEALVRAENDKQQALLIGEYGHQQKCLKHRGGTDGSFSLNNYTSIYIKRLADTLTSK
jgi:hypothetical protein